MKSHNWIVIGKSNGGKITFFEEGKEEHVSRIIPDDVVKLDNGEFAIVYEKDNRISLFTQHDMLQQSLDYDSYRGQ